MKFQLEQTHSFKNLHPKILSDIWNFEPPSYSRSFIYRERYPLCSCIQVRHLKGSTFNYAALLTFFSKICSKSKRSHFRLSKSYMNGMPTVGVGVCRP